MEINLAQPVQLSKDSALKPKSLLLHHYLPDLVQFSDQLPLLIKCGETTIVRIDPLLYIY